MAKHKKHISRRKFLGDSCAALGYTTLFSSLINLKAMAATAMDNSSLITLGGDYKAMVCVLLGGGNDSFNMLIPKGNTEYNEYAATRSNLAIPQNDVLQINPNTTDGRTFGLHPSMPDMQQLFENGNLAFLSNVGTLIEPSSKTDLLNGAVKTPLGLFSHADQIQQWQTGRPHERTNTGWGGKIADLVHSMNSNRNISMNISLRGSNIFQRGNEVTPYAISNNGSIGINGYGESGQFNELKTAALNTMLERDYQDIYKNAYKNTIKTSNDANLEFQAAVDGVSDFSTIIPEYNNLARQFRMVAKTIASRDTLGFSRQIFFVQLGGWDHHDELLINQSNKLAQVNSALKYFNDVMTELNVSDCVTTFSVSDFSTIMPEYNNLARQLRMVAKTIGSRDTLGFSRQIFFVQLGGWDHHDELLINQSNKLAQVNSALKYFNDVMTELNVSDCVTTFSVSDFARTLTSNGNGTDHAWGGNAFMMGGAVNGKEIYGDYPNLSLSSDLIIDGSVLIPTTAADMYMAELALWFGVPASELATILPNISNFYDTASGVSPLGFMNML